MRLETLRNCAVAACLHGMGGMARSQITMTFCWPTKRRSVCKKWIRLAVL